MRHSSLLPALAAVLLLSTSALPQVDVSRVDGKPKFAEGKALGYFVWKDGDTFKVRWTTFGAQHRFTGRVVVEGGQIKSFKRIDVDEERKVLVPGRAPHVVRGPAGRVRGVTGGRRAVVATKTQDKIEQDDERTILFNTLTDDDIDGLDFKVTDDARAVRLLLQIDGVPKPAEIEVGRENFKPNETPLVIRIH
jgi:hypothetical protein